MSHLGQTLAALIDRHWESQRAFARKCGLDQSTIHHVIGGRPCSRDNLRLFCEHISADPVDKFAILLAHLQDEAEASGLDLRQLVLRRIDEPSLSELHTLHPAIRRQLALVGIEAATHPDVRDVLNSLAGMIEANKGRAGNLYPFPDHGTPKKTAGQTGKPGPNPALPRRSGKEHTG